MNSQEVICEGCGSVWRIWGYGKNTEIFAELVNCPMCDTDVEAAVEKAEARKK